MAPLHERLRRGLERQVIRAREFAEEAAEAALSRLAVAAKEPHGHLSSDERVLRNRLRERARALGDKRRPNGTQDVERLLEEVAYESWHRMLFARFLAENNLLVHPEHGVSVSLAECEDLARDEGTEDKWVLAARYASRMLPQIFRPQDPSLQISFAPEHRIGLEQILEEITPEVFRADDSLGWVYQFWQSERKDVVNAAGESITGETLPAVTQLFTEPYMVSFLIENTIGAWWTARHPGVALPIEMPYLRRLEDGTPAAGSFEGWPTSWNDFTLLDPCCGSGHFLVAALRLIVPLRMHDGRLTASEAVSAAIRENLYGLELDPRCTQIAAFAVALAAWTTPGAHGYRPLPEIQIACSGLAVGSKREEWVDLADGDQRFEAALGGLHDLFKLAPELGSLIDPTVNAADLLNASFAEVRPLLERALQSELTTRDQGLEATAVAAQGIAKAAELLARKYTLVATNVPYLGREKQSEVLKAFADADYSRSKYDLATVFIERIVRLCASSGMSALVAPLYWTFLTRYKRLREHLLRRQSLTLLAKLGPRAFATIGGEVVNVLLFISKNATPADRANSVQINASAEAGPGEKAAILRSGSLELLSQHDQLEHSDHVIGYSGTKGSLLNAVATSYQGLATSDNAQFVQTFWERPSLNEGWERYQAAPEKTAIVAGASYILHWEDGRGRYYRHAMGLRSIGLLGGWKSGGEAWGRRGVVVNRMSNLPVALYFGQKFDCNAAVIVPDDAAHVAPVFAYCSSEQFSRDVRGLNTKLSVTNATLAKVPFDLSHWSRVAEEMFPDGLPAARSNDPTQWLFRGDIPSSTAPLQVAVARLLGYRWPDQLADANVDSFVDADGVVCLAAVRGERAASERLSELLSAAYGEDWSLAKREELISEAGFADKTLDDWLRDGFFEQHCKLFHQRPFIWHITDKARGGFSALVNYHKLDRKTLEALTYTYLGDWINRQEDARKRDEQGADLRLAAARDLQDKLKLILEGEPPYDIFVRWKSLAEQPVGWEPDLNDGMRLNIWPFVQAGVLRSKVNINWKKDRGQNPPDAAWGEDRHNRYEDIPPDDRPAPLCHVNALMTEIKRRARADSSQSVHTRVAEAS